MAGFRFDVFKGIRPRISKRKLPPGEAQTAQNTKLGSADLEYWNENGVVKATENPYDTRAIFLYEDTKDNIGYWFEWADYVDVARGPIKGDTLDRVYFTGDGVPKMTYNDLQTSPPYPSVAYDLGVPKPATRLQATGQELPEDLAPASRRTSEAPGERPSTGSFEIVSADFTTYPGTGTPNDTWRFAAGALGSIAFQVDVGDTFRVEEVVDEDNITLGSATGTGAVGATAANDKTSVTYWKPMDEQGSTQLADFIGWRIPDGMRVTVPGHRLRAGDVIRVTRLDLSFGMEWYWSLTGDLFELAPDGTAGDWGVPVQGDDNVYRHENVRLGKSADGQQLFELNGGFYYDVDRTSSDNATLEDRTYVYTYVSAIGEEGPPSDPSALVQALDGDTVTLTGFDLGAAGVRDIDRVRIYRTNATAVGTEYQFVREVTLAAIQADGNAVDTIEAALLGEVIPSNTWLPPPDEMENIVSMPNGMMVGSQGKNIYFCEPFFPHAWPPEYDQAVDYDVVALAPFGNSVAVLTRGTPYVITGSHPRNANIRPYKINQACLNKESVALAKDRVYYASPDGLVEIGVNGARLTTDRYVWKNEWAQFSPELMVGEFHDGKYFGFYGADNTVVPQPTGSLAATGTLVTDDENFEADIVAGGKTIILTLTDETWVTAGTAFDAIRDDIIFGITSNLNEPGSWNAARATVPVTDVVRTSNTVVTITLSALPTYSISENETLSFKAPALAISGSSPLLAPETAIVQRDSIYSSQVVVTTSYSTTVNVPEILFADEAIDNWVRVSAPSGLTTADAPNLTDAAFHKGANRWAVVGWNFLGPSNNDCIVLTSDDVDDGSSWVKRSLPAVATNRPGRTIIYDDVTDALFIGGDSALLMHSYDGINWASGFLPGSLQGRDIIKFARAPQGGGGTTPRLYAIFSGIKNVARSADLASAPLTTAWTDLGTFTTGGTGLSAIASGNSLVYITNDTGTAEIGYFTQGGTTYNSIGNLGMDAADMVFGNGRLVVISANGRIQYADAPDEVVIGNWSVVSAAIDGAGTRDLAKIEYDGGDAERIGYGFIATLSASGAPGDYLVYTSPDAVTWTLRETVSNASDALGIGVKNPEFDLAGTGGAVVTLSGGNIYFGDFDVAPSARLIVRADGTIDKQKNLLTPVQIYPGTDWIIPNFLADSTYDVRVTNVVWIRGTTWAASPGADGTWFALSADRTWQITPGDLVRFTLEIRKDAGPVLDANTYSLGSQQFIIYRDRDWWRYGGNYNIP